MNEQLTAAFEWLAGCDRHLLDKCPRSERTRMAMLGATVLVSGITSLAGMTLYARDAGFSIPAAAFAGLAWSAVVMSIDRALLATYRPFQPWFVRAQTVSLRLLMAALISTVISVPLTLDMFRTEIRKVYLDELTTKMESLNSKEGTEKLKERIAALEDGRKKAIDPLEESIILVRIISGNYQSYARRTRIALFYTCISTLLISLILTALPTVARNISSGPYDILFEVGKSWSHEETDAYFNEAICSHVDTTKAATPPVPSHLPSVELPVFICHVTPDDQFVDKLTRRLEDEPMPGYRIRTLYDHRDIELGDNWEAWMLDCARSARFMIVLISPEIVESKHTTTEFMTHVTTIKDKGSFIPLFVRDRRAEPPFAFEGMPLIFRSFHCLDFREGVLFDSSYLKLVGHIQRHSRDIS